MIGQQLTLGRLITAAAARRATLEHLEGEHEAWIARAVNAISGFAVGDMFTTDRLWAMVAAGDLPRVGEPRAMGGAVAVAKKLRLIAHTHSYEPSTRAACKARPVAIWRRI